MGAETLCHLHYILLCFDWGPPKQVSKQPKLRLIRQQGITPNIALHRSVSMGLCQRLRGCAFTRTRREKKPTQNVIRTTQLCGVTRCSKCFISFSNIDSFSCSSGTLNESQA